MCACMHQCTRDVCTYMHACISVRRRACIMCLCIMCVSAAYSSAPPVLYVCTYLSSACMYLSVQVRAYQGMHAPSTCVTVAVCTSKYIKYQQKLLETWEPRTVYNKPLKMKPPKPRGLGGRRQVPRSGRATAQSAKQAQSRTCTQTRLPDSPPGFGFRVSRLACRAQGVGV